MRFPLLHGEEGSAVRVICDLCDGEIYWNEEFYCIDGEIICDHCIGDYAKQIFASFRKGGEI